MTAGRAKLQHVLEDKAGNVQGLKAATILEKDGSTPYAGTLYDAASGGSIVTSPQSNAAGLLELYVDKNSARRAVVRVANAADLNSAFELDPEDLIFQGMTAAASLAGTLGVTGLLTASGGAAVSRNDASNWALTADQTDATAGKAIRVQVNGTSEFEVTKDHGRFPVGLAVGTTVVPSGNLFLVSKTASETSGQMASYEYNNTGGTGGDVSSLRVIARAMTSGNNQIRPVESHMIRTTGSGDKPTHALELTIQGNVAESVAGFYHNGLRIASLSTTWSVSGGVRQGNGIFIGQDENGFQNGILYRGTAAESNIDLFYVDKAGKLYAVKATVPAGTAAAPTYTFNGALTDGIYLAAANTLGFAANGLVQATLSTTALTTKAILPVATDTHNLGGGSARWLIVFANAFEAENGSAAGPSHIFRNDTQSGLFLQAVGAPAIAAGTTEVMRWTSTLTDFRVGGVALGGGAAPTLGTIGGSGPGTAGQNSWLKIAIAGTASFLPVWR